MHELLLFGQVPVRSHELVLKVLAGVFATQPRVYTTHHLLFKPTRSPANITAAVHAARAAKANTAAQGTQQATDIFYLQLVGHLSDTLEESKDGNIGDESFDGVEAVQPSVNEDASNGVSTNGTVNLKKCPWTLEYRDLPDVPGRRPVTSRQIATVPVKSGSPVSFVEEMGYSYLTSYVQHGYELIHKNVQLLLIRTMPIPQLSNTPPVPPAVPELSTLHPLDASGGYMLQASVRIADSRPEIMSQGISELTNLRDTLKGVVEMEVGDRLALDTRVR